MSQQPCLPFAPFVATTKRKRQDEEILFDPNVLNASDYLRLVAQEARSISDEMLIASSPSVVSFKSHLMSLPIIDGSAASMQYLLSHHTQIAPPPSAIRQSHEAAWILQALEQFAQLRDYLYTCQHEHGVGGKNHRLLPKVPPMKDATGWVEFCIGIQLSTDGDNNDDDNNNTDETNEKKSSTPTWRQTLPAQGYHSPSVQLLCQLDQVMIRRVLAHLTGVASTSTSTTTQQQRLFLWLYALMARLETPVHGQDAATLRKLVVTVAARRAIETNTTMSKDNYLAAMNLILVVAGLYFGQASYTELFP